MGLVPLFVTAPFVFVPLGELVREDGPIIRGTYDGSRVWAGTAQRGAEKGVYPSGGGFLRLSRQDVAPDARPQHLQVPVWSHPESPSFPQRGRYVPGRYHFVHITGFDTSWTSMMVVTHFASAPVDAIETYNTAPLQAAKHLRDFQAALADTTHTRVEPLIDTGINATGAQFDFLPRADGGYEFYLLQARYRRMTRWDLLPKKGGKGLEWKEVARWKADWVMPFYVAASGPNRFFVTELGRVFAAPAADKPDTPLKLTWDGPPVRAIVHDATQNRDYVFTAKHFFEVGDPTKIRLHEVAQVRGRTADEALATLAQCAAAVKLLTSAAFKPEP